MKKIFKMMFAVVAGVAALTACTNEPEEGVTPTPGNEGKIVLVTVGLGDETRSTFNDGESIKWSIGDVIDYKGTKNSNTQSFTLNESMLSSDGYSATLGITITDPTLEATGFFTYHKWADNEFAMTNSNVVNANRTQSEAGVMNTDWLFLHSGLEQVVIPANADSYKLEMEIVGTIFRVIPYTTTYNDETIQSVMMMSNSDMVGTVRYWREVAEPYYEAPLWGNSKFLDITLETPFSLEGVTSAETSKGIYFPVSATKEGAPLNGYKYVVTTDKATYTFSAMDKELVVAENTVKNVLLNLDNGSRIGNDDFKGYVYYEGGPHNETINADQTFLNSIGYTVARYSDANGENWVYATEAKGQHEWLYNATYKYYDMNGNEVAAEDSWVTMGFSENNICHWCVNAEVNTSVEQRQMKVVGQIVAPKGYKLAVWFDNLNEKEYKYEFIITQKANIVVTGELNNVYADTVPAAGATIEAATLALNVNGVAATDIAAAMSTYGITVEAGSATATVNANGKITLVVPENPYKEIRTYDLVVKFDDNIVTSTKISQAEGAEEMPYIYNYTFGAWSGAQGTEVTLNWPASGVTNEWLAVFNSVTLKSGENLTVNDIDVNLFISQVFHSEQLEYDWISFNLEGPFNDYKLRCTLAPNTGAKRTAVLYAYVSDGSDSWWRKITINQDPGM